MAKGLGTLTVWLTADTSKYRKGMTSAQSQMAKFSSAVKLGMTAAGAAIGAFGVSSVRAFMVQEKAENELSAALRNVGQSASFALPVMKKYASEVQRQTIYGDEAILSAAAYGKNLGINTAQMKDATTAAVGLAAKYNIDLNTSMMLVGRAAMGQTQMLTRYGIVLDETLSPQEKFNALLKIGAASFGLAKEESNTLAGGLKQMGNAWGDVKESIGQAISESLRLPDVFKSIADSFADFADYLQSKMGGIVYMSQAIMVEFKYAFLQIFTAAKNVGTGIGDIIANAGRNIQSFTEFIWDNFSKIFKNVFNLAAAFGKDFVGVFYEIGQQMFAALTGEDTDWTGVMARMGKNIETAMAKAGIGKLEISQPDFSGSFGKIYSDISDLDAKRMADLDANFKTQMDKFGKPIDRMPKSGPAAAAKASANRMESSVVGAIQRGSVEALKAENTRVRKDTEIATNTKRTAAATESIAKSIGNIVIRQFSPTEDAFA